MKSPRASHNNNNGIMPHFFAFTSIFIRKKINKFEGNTNVQPVYSAYVAAHYPILYRCSNY